MRSFRSNKALVKLFTLGCFLVDSEKALSDFRKNSAWSPISKVRVPENLIFNKQALAITAHVHNGDFAQVLVKELSKFKNNFSVFITTTSDVLKSMLESELSKANIAAQVTLCTNKGRNFGPLFVEFSSELKHFASFVHIHSKKTEHAKPTLGLDWGSRNNTFFLSEQNLLNLSTLANTRKELAICYVDASDLLRGINYRWGLSRQAARDAISTSRIGAKIKWRGKIAFPAGGMFWVRTSAVGELLDVPWDYSMFPEEVGQLDGTVQHGIERLIGTIVSAKGLDHLVYKSDSGIFTTDTSYCL